MPYIVRSIRIPNQPETLQSESGLTLVTIVFTGSWHRVSPEDPWNFKRDYYMAADVVVQCHPDYQVVSFETEPNQTTLVLAGPTGSSGIRRLRRQIEQISQDHQGINYHIDDKDTTGSIDVNPGLWRACQFIQMAHRVFPMTTHRGPDGQHRVFAEAPELVRDGEQAWVKLVSYHPRIEESNPVSRQVIRHIWLLYPERRGINIQTLYGSHP